MKNKEKITLEIEKIRAKIEKLKQKENILIDKYLFPSSYK